MKFNKLLVTLCCLLCFGCKNVFNYFPTLNYNKDDIKCVLTQENINDVFLDLVMFNSCNSVENSGLLYFVHPFNRDGRHVAKIFSLDDRFCVVERLKIPSGKGPGEAIAVKHILFKDGGLYVWDPNLYRFLIYDENFEFVDTYNLEHNISITSFYSHNDMVYAISGQEGRYDIYEVKFTDNMKLRFVKSLKYKTDAENKQVRFLRTRVSVFRETKDDLILKAFNLVLFYDKEKMEFTREISLGFEKTGGEGVVEPNLIYISGQGDALYSYRYTEAYVARKGKTKSLKLDHKGIVKQLNINSNFFTIVKKADKFEVFQEKNNKVL